MNPATDHHPHPVTRAELARRAGKSRSTITELAAGILRACCLPGGRLDAAHPEMVRVAREVWRIDPAVLLDFGGATSSPAPAAEPSARVRKPRRSSPPESTTASDVVSPSGPPESLSSVLDLRLRDITQRFGSVTAFKDWLDARKVVAETHRLESRNDRDEGRLLAREHVRHFAFGYLGELSRRLLGDVPRNLASKLERQVEREERERIIRDAIGAQIAGAKGRIQSAILACKTGDNPPEVTEIPASAANNESAARAAVIAELRGELGKASREIVDAQARTVARLGAGAKFDAETFERIKSAQQEIASESLRLVTTILESAIRRAERTR